MNFVEYTSKYKPLINDNISIILKEKINQADDEFLKRYYTELEDYMLSGGKRIRPLLSVACYNALSDKNDDRILKPCVGLEFLHNASLVHDDIIDNDDVRRGYPSFHARFKTYHMKEYNSNNAESKEFGNSIGIIGGDTTFFLGLEAFFDNQYENEVNLSAIKIYEKAFLEVADGVLIEMDMIRRQNLDMSNYIKMISLKTSALIEKALLIGCNYALADESTKNLFSNFGINLGRAFQITDDILGTFGDEKTLGKPTDSDIREGKKTCLLIEAMNKLGSQNKIKLSNLIGKKDMTGNEVKEVKELFREAKVEESCRKLAQEYYENAFKSLEKLKDTINKSEYQFFDTLLKFVVKRKF